jgi:hypothetical protein
MKRLIAILALLAIAFAPLGCKSPERTAYQTIGSVAVSVDGAMSAWGDYVRAGLAKPEQETRVRGAYLKYQAAMKTAETVVLAARAAPEGEASYQTALRAAGAAAADIIALVEQFTGKKLLI